MGMTRFIFDLISEEDEVERVEKLSLPRKRRWKALFDKLDSLPRKKFDFSVWGKDLDKPTAIARPSLRKCTTVGCIAGWLPTFFPKSWEWSGHQGPNMRGREPGFPVTDFSVFMGVSEELAHCLLIPFGNSIGSGNNISSTVTPKQWVKAARKMLKEQYKDVP